MPHLPVYIAPSRFTDPAAALAKAREIYEASLAHLRDAMQRFVAGETLPSHVRACYPFVRVQTDTVSRQNSPDSIGLSYGFVAGPGRFETTLTRPDLYGSYYLEQFKLLLDNHKMALEVGTSTQPIPVHFSFAENDHIEGALSAARRQLMRDVFDLPDLTAMDEAGKAMPTHKRTGAFIPKIAAEIQRREQRKDLPYYLIGHSAGGQFLVRTSAFVDTGAARIVAGQRKLFLLCLLPFTMTAQQVAEVKPHQGKPTLFVNGQPQVPLFYALTHAYGGRWSWEEVPARNLRNFAPPT